MFVPIIFKIRILGAKSIYSVDKQVYKWKGFLSTMELIVLAKAFSVYLWLLHSYTEMTITNQESLMIVYN